mmetsp:Transcript_18153/g.19678  ORF Transcript_18153/g.19678 Transcript_18153/m.19678 type:complete len:102 (+) Transcript_18153:32-337(+)
MHFRLLLPFLFLQESAAFVPIIPSSSSPFLYYSTKHSTTGITSSFSSSSLSLYSRRPDVERVPPSNPEEIEAARNGKWNYEKGYIVEKKGEEEEEFNADDF